ncbi:MAG: TetR/AcrR family transcriptional regulator [Chloroflexia bacterium]|nr:TetR/AcrR family transcriptional regulator [Chloroflexia bacterium]
MITESGADGLSVRALAGRVDYSPGALYKYFQNKDDLLDAVRAAGFQQLRDRILAIPMDRNPGERIVKAGEVYLAFAGEHPEQYFLMFANRAGFSDAASTAAGRSAYDALRNIVDAGIQSHKIRNEPGFGLDEIAYGCWAIVHGLAMIRLLFHGHGLEHLAATERRILEAYVAGVVHESN